MQQTAASLEVDVIDDVFLRDAHSYKAALFRDTSLTSGFWSGTAIDKQITYGTRDVAKYWIQNFLFSEFETTSRAGTQRLADALNAAARSTENSEVQQQIAAVATLSPQIQGRVTTVDSFCQDVGFSEQTKEAVRAHIPNESLVTAPFEFDRTEFHKRLPYRSVDLSNGATLTAPADKFDEVFDKYESQDRHHEYIYRTQGEIVNDHYKKRR